MGSSSHTSVVGYAIDNLLRKVLYAIEEELGILDDFPRQIESLQDELHRKHCFCMSNRCDWADQARKLVHDAEDLIDEFLLSREKQTKKKGIHLIHQKYKQWCNSRRITREIEAFKVRVVNHIGQSSGHNTHKEAPQRAPSYSRIPTNEIVGLEDEVNKLVEQFLLDAWWPRSVVPIVGMGGIGKSTLAWKVYNRPDIQGSFTLKAWISITQCFNYRDVLIRILSSICQVEDHELRSWRTEKLENTLNRSLSERPYLVVLDDVWSPPGHPAWERLLNAFPDSWNKSRIILTTRKNNVAVYAAPRRAPFRMKYLGDRESWMLFSEKVSIRADDIEFQDIGKQIVRKCGGLPLSIVATARRFKAANRRRADWDKEREEMEGRPLLKEIYECLELSYNDLTPELKYCFLHMGIFPENCTIPTRKLTHIWTAEELIIEQEGKRAEDVTESHLDALVQKNMIQPIEISPDGRIKTCKIDHSLRQLCIMKAKEEILLEIQSDCDFQPSNQCCHWAIHSSMDRYFDFQDSNCPLRTLASFVPNETISFAQLELISKRFKLLRVLHLEGMTVRHIPNEVGELRNLRYVNLRNTRIDQLPKSMRNLKKLLTLDIRDNTYLSNLTVVEDMKNLRNLYLPGLGEEFKVHKLSQLQTLKRVTLVSLECLKSLAELTTLQTLQFQLGGGPLNLNCFLESAKELKHLESLHLYPDIGIPSLAHGKFECLSSLTKLYVKGGVRELPKPEEFPPNLMQLTLDGSGLTPFTLEELGRLQKLSILRLRNLYIIGEKLSFAANGFPRLKYLELQTLWNLKDLELQGTQASQAFQQLKYLKISNCTALNGLPTELKQLTLLSELQIDRMSEKFEKKIRRGNWYKLHDVIRYTNTL